MPPRAMSSRRAKEERPTTMAERLSTEKEQAWVYGATGSYVPEGLNKGQSGWAALTSWVLLWSTRLAE
eukprot:1734248-Pyramimonas_sp.AAC.1